MAMFVEVRIYSLMISAGVRIFDGLLAASSDGSIVMSVGARISGGSIVMSVGKGGNCQ